MVPDPFNDVRYFVDENLLGFYKLLSRSAESSGPGGARAVWRIRCEVHRHTNWRPS